VNKYFTVYRTDSYSEILIYLRGLFLAHEQAGAASLIFQALVLAMAVTVYLINPFGQQASLILFLLLTVSDIVLSETFFVYVGGKDILHYNWLINMEMCYGTPEFREARLYRAPRES